MRCVRLALFALIITGLTIGYAGAVSITLNGSTKEAHIGDTITLSGTISGVKTIAVYLFLTGPDLNPRGVTLENLNIPAGHGLFTTAPVDITTGRWTYDWDTSVILGNLKPGKYTVYAVYSVSTPLGRLGSPGSDYAMTDIDFLPPVSPTNEVPIPSFVPVAALAVVAGIVVVKRWN